MTDTLRDLFHIDLPIFQAPMAGVSTPALAAAVSKAGGLGALGLGAATDAGARQMVQELQALTDRPINLNFFCHEAAQRDSAKESAWIDRTRPLFAEYGAEPPTPLEEIYPSFRADDRQLAIVLDTRPAVASFHFGLPKPDQISAMKQAGITLTATATSLAEAHQIAAAGFDAIIAQGWQAGGHRGIFDPFGPDERLPTWDLLKQLVGATSLPVIAAGGIMTGADVRHALSLGAVAAQLGTAFVGCPETSADGAYRARLPLGGTQMTSVISGRPARCLTNRFTDWGQEVTPDHIPAYPCTYDLGKSLNAAAKAKGETGFGAQWAGDGAARVRPMPAAELMALLIAELVV
ncbi:NAD(P)H-dependent flavin oxidoreductase [Donghicola mangrovi]|uniref:Nitronate monooxygenase n=1 Tax=Donghicola mangrovi TaxID=2729614 RepID=A0A850Q7Q0_9RHOB|nr:nitronate monooxygenase [Donghicola mangrovi]NVO25166.1 nitronate monooxygenase [Donghicola mangrovi]